MKERIGFVAIGQAGGNIGQLFEKNGHPVLYVNTSSEDLATLKDAKHKYHIPGGEGCNKDRNKAKQLVIEDFDNIASKIDDTLVKADIIYVLFAAGGGTGSGAGPMLIDLLLDEESEQNRSVGAITIIPAESESIKSQINAYECFGELVDIEASSSVFVIDNNRGEKIELNPKFVSAFDDFLAIPHCYKNSKGNIDKAEVVESLKAHGMAVVMSCESSELSQMITSINNNIFAPIEQDHTVKYIASACAESVNDLSEIEKAVGKPWDSYRAYTSDDRSVLLMSGMTYPIERLELIHDAVQGNKDIIIKNLSSGKATSLKNDFDFLSGTDHVKATVKPRKSRNDIINRYCKKQNRQQGELTWQ